MKTKNNQRGKAFQMVSSLGFSVMFGLLVLAFFAPAVWGQDATSDDASDSGRGRKGKEKNWYKIPGVTWEATLGLGYNSNVFRSPSGDFTHPTLGLKTSTVNSGLFLPLEMVIKYSKKLGQTNNLVVGLETGGDFYVDPAQKNADEYVSSITLGDNIIFWEKEKREHSLYLGVYGGKNRKIYFNRYTGTDWISGSGVKYTYKNRGVETRYVNEREENLGFSLEASQETRDYERPPANAYDYDVTILTLQGDVNYAFSKATKASLRVRLKTNNYDTRPAWVDTGATLTLTGAPLVYKYTYTTLGLRQKLGENFTLSAGLKKITRKDETTGYNNSDTNLFKLNGLWHVTEKWKTRFAFSSWKRTYENALAFDAAGQVLKVYDGTNMGLKATYHTNKNRNYEFDVKYKDQNTNDLRFEYDRLMVAATMNWKY